MRVPVGPDTTIQYIQFNKENRRQDINRHNTSQTWHTGNSLYTNRVLANMTSDFRHKYRSGAQHNLQMESARAATGPGWHSPLTTQSLVTDGEHVNQPCKYKMFNITCKTLEETR